MSAWVFVSFPSTINIVYKWPAGLGSYTTHGSVRVAERPSLLAAVYANQKTDSFLSATGKKVIMEQKRPDT